MAGKTQNILILGSNVLISSLPIKEVSLLREGSLPAYGYNPGDSLELLAGRVTIEEGRQEQCLTWLQSMLEPPAPATIFRTWTYGEPREVYQFFRRRKIAVDDSSRGWFMFHQILPPEGRNENSQELQLTRRQSQALLRQPGHHGHRRQRPAARPAPTYFKKHNPAAWVIGMGISVAHWHEWTAQFGPDFCLFCRLADLETTRMEMDSGLTWETLVAMALRALQSPEVGLWDADSRTYKSHVIIEMFPHGLLYVGPEGILFRHRKLCRPEKSSPRHRGSVPCYDTLVTSMLALDCIRTGRLMACQNYFYDFSDRVLQQLAVPERTRLFLRRTAQAADPGFLPYLQCSRQLPALGRGRRPLPDRTFRRRSGLRSHPGAGLPPKLEHRKEEGHPGFLPLQNGLSGPWPAPNCPPTSWA